MDLEEWINLPEHERMQHRHQWDTQNSEGTLEFRNLFLEAVKRFRALYQQHPKIFAIRNTLHFAVGFDPSILVYSSLWQPDTIESLPHRFATFAVKQYPQTERFRVVKREDNFAFYEAHYEETGKLIFVSQDPVTITVTSFDEWQMIQRQCLFALQNPILQYELVDKSQHGL